MLMSLISRKRHLFVVFVWQFLCGGTNDCTGKVVQIKSLQSQLQSTLTCAAQNKAFTFMIAHCSCSVGVVLDLENANAFVL